MWRHQPIRRPQEVCDPGRRTTARTGRKKAVRAAKGTKAPETQRCKGKGWSRFRLAAFECPPSTGFAFHRCSPRAASRKTDSQTGVRRQECQFLQVPIWSELDLLLGACAPQAAQSRSRKWQISFASSGATLPMRGKETSRTRQHRAQMKTRMQAVTWLDARGSSSS